jgi:Secretion system C-terminal sorting domain
LDSLLSFTSTNLTTNQPESRAVLTYNTTENSTNTTLEFWDGAAWVLLFNTYLDNSAAGQIEQLDIFIDLPGFLTIGTRQVYIFPNGNECAGFANIYISEDNINWTYLGRTFIYYNGSTIPTNSLINNELKLSTTPNPFTEKLIVSTDIDSEIKVFSTSGTLLLTKKSTDENTVLNTETLPIGTYFIVVNKNGKSERKLVVKG